MSGFNMMKQIKTSKSTKRGCMRETKLQATEINCEATKVITAKFTETFKVVFLSDLQHETHLNEERRELVMG